MLKIGIRLRIHPPKHRNPMQRLKSRLYYRRNRSKIRLQRRKYLRSHRTVLKHRKMFQRYKPSWYKHPKHVKPPKPHKIKIRVPQFKHPSPKKTHH